MKLYVLRHANAEDRDAEKYPDDVLRPLTPKGIETARKVATWVKSRNMIPDIILTSPAIRAFDTAKICAEKFGLAKDYFVVTDLLLPGLDREKLVAQINANYCKPSLLLVGHEPDLSSLLSTLISGGDTLQIHLKKAGMCCLTIDHLQAGKCAILEWLIDPVDL
jgi:phosphohistidine phosphatase